MQSKPARVIRKIHMVEFYGRRLGFWFLVPAGFFVQFFLRI